MIVLSGALIGAAFGAFLAKRRKGKTGVMLVGGGSPDQVIWDAEASGSLVYTVSDDGTLRVVDMGDVVEPRREFIQANALNVENLDF